MEQLFEKYQNIKLCLTQYRKFSLIENQTNESKSAPPAERNEFFNFEEFKRKMQLTSYVVHHLENKKDGTRVDAYLFKADSKYMRTTSEFTKLLDRYREPYHIMIFSKEKLNTYLAKAVRKYSSLKIENFLHKHFIVELSKGPLCSEHRVLSPEETKEVCLDLMAHGHKLPAIPVDDPQNIWIGGKINEVVKIVRYSEITGLSIGYRIITPVSGKIGQSSVIKKEDVTGVPLEPGKDAPAGDKEVGEVGEVDEVENYEDYEDDYE
jgi:DNA-directed RNA polymerase subunit H (RpoH/RPB5)